MSYSIDTLDIDLRVSTRSQEIGHREFLSIGSYNIQKTKQLSIVARLAANYDVFFIQEFEATSKNTEAMHQFAHGNHRQFITSPVDSGRKNLTGIFINPTTVEILGDSEIHRVSDHKRYSTDVRARTKMGGHIIFQNLYLPSAAKNLHAPILENTLSCFESMQQDNESLQLFYGGDFNNSVENTPSTETEGVLAIAELNQYGNTEDIAAYEPTISISPTNRSSTARRLDRFYAPKRWRGKAHRFRILDPVGITSSHNLITVQYLINTLSEVQVGKPRFQFPLRRLQPPFNRATTWHLHDEATTDEVIHSIQSDGQEYIEFMGYLRKNNPDYLKFLLSEGEAPQAGKARYQAAKTFFQTKHSERVIFKKLSNSEANTEATSTPAMLKLASAYYRALYLSPALPNWNELQRFLRPLKPRVKRDQRIELEKLFTKRELELALNSMDKSTAPGPDGIQYSVLQYYWNDVGASLTRAANDMMRTGKLPPCFQKVLITLIPKLSVAKSKDIKDQRPISLSNTCIKVISKAVCRRLQNIMGDLVGPYQRGFIRNRRIDQNTMEFFTMLDLFKKLDMEPVNGEAVLMIDFTKAFDRISHHYMRRVLLRMGIGQLLVMLIMLILTDQHAQITINNWEGEQFPLRCGTRQGNPLSPLLFNLALEPLLMHLNALNGIPVVYEGVLIENMKYHAFADDVNIYLGNEKDYHTAAEAIQMFERVSNSQVSEAKTRLLGFHQDYADYEQNIFSYNQSYLWSEDLKYLGLTLNGVDWLRFLSILPFTTMQAGYMQIDIITRAICTNMLVASRTVYKDLVQCMGDSQLRKMDDQIHKVFKWTSCEKLYARPKNGGYGLLEMRTQLLGHRAAVLLSTLGEESDWYTKYMRLKLIHHMAKITARDRRTHISRAKGLNCSDFLLDSSGRFFNKFDWTFTRSEKFYLQAWLKVARRTRNVAPIVLPEETVIEQTYEAPDGGEHGFSLTPNELKACEKKNFQSLSKTKQEALPPVMPGRFTEICPEVKRRRRWEKFWKQLHKFEWKKHLNLQAIHRFNFGSHVPFHDTKRPIRDHKCLLCLQEVNLTQRLFHLYTECGETLKVWELLGIQTPMKLESMLAPLTNTYEELRNLNWYVDTVRRVYLSRRQEQSRGVPLRVLTGRQLKMALARSKALTS